MALDPTAREANVKDSIKKFFVDNIEVTEAIPVMFDIGLDSIDTVSGDVRKWITVAVSITNLDLLSEAVLTIYICTRKDNEGFILSQVRDKVMGYLQDETQDGFTRIPFYQSSATAAWVLIGALLVSDVRESPRPFIGKDATKYKILDVTLKFTAKA